MKNLIQVQASYKFYMDIQRVFIFYFSFKTIKLISVGICTSNRMVSSAINDKFNQGASQFSESFGRGTFSSLSYHESISLSARETMRLLINHQLSPIAIQPKSISHEQICYKRSQGIDVTSVHCLLFSMSKNKDLKRFSINAINVVLALKFLWTSHFVFSW